jgi:hypothetical protein
LVNTKYRLAGGTETYARSSGLAGLNNGRDDEFGLSGTGPEIDYRPSRYQNYNQPPPLATNSRKRSRRLSTDPSEAAAVEKAKANGNHPEKGWGKAVISLVGNVAEKVWDFCWSGPFRGFYAGGGQGYDVNAAGTSSPPGHGSSPLGRENMGNICEKGFGPIPGQFPADPRQPQDELR